MKSLFKNLYSVSKEQSRSLKTTRSFSNQSSLRSKHAARSNKILPRILSTFINDSLYDPTEGYFSKHVSIHSPQKPIDFRAITDQQDYFRVLRQFYANNSWKTPVETFGRIYTDAIAKCILKTHAKSAKKTGELKLFEIGSGNGTLARGILDFLRENDQTLYSRTTYTAIDISPRLAQLAREKNVEHKNFTVHQCSVFDWKEKCEEECFVVALEVLDNLAHDKVVRMEDGELYEAHVVKSSQKGGFFDEVYLPLSNPLLMNYLSVVPMPDEPLEVLYAPTHAMLLLQHIAKMFPRHHLALTDFDRFPENAQWESTIRNMPRVHRTVKGQTEEFDNYLDMPFGSCDIYFPTSFRDLQTLHKGVCGRKGEVLTNSEFMQQFASVELCRTKSGYNPLLDDYKNTSFFLS